MNKEAMFKIVKELPFDKKVTVYEGTKLNVEIRSQSAILTQNSLRVHSKIVLF